MEKPTARRPPRFLPWLLFALAVSGWWMWSTRRPATPESEIDYSQLYAWVEGGKVERVVIRGAELEGHLSAPEKLGEQTIQDFRAVIAHEDQTLLPTLREKHVEIRFESADRSLFVQLIVSLLPWVLIIGVWIWISRRARALPGGPFGGSLKSPSRKFETATAAKVTFDDVAGLKAAKRDLQEIVEFLRSPGRFRALGARVPRGVLLIGPPGTGKTLLARAVAGESGVAFYSISGSEFIEMFVGLGAARVRELFEEAKKNAPAIVFIDEIDAVGRTRGASLISHEEREQTLNQLLFEMDGFNRNDDVVVLAATNRPDVLDAALLRPGRFDRRVIVERPELPARKAILEVHTKNKPLDADVELELVAKNTPGFSGADLANLVNEAALLATRRAATKIAARDFADAFDKIVLGDPSEAKLSSKEKERVAVHEAGHAVVARFTPEAETPERVSILPRGLALGATQQASPEHDRHVLTKRELEARLEVLMGGYAAEKNILGDTSTGAENDLKEATHLAYRMVARFGMSERLGPAHFEFDVEHPFLGRGTGGATGTSDATAHAIEDEAKKLLERAVEAAGKTIAAHHEAIDRLARALIEHETLDKQELLRLLPAQRICAVS